ncbi:hypothetical protein lerEdw1_000402 [Lerista edwardsae]|nr:hypothetical protein lerEdw1_000402 [Lerista edwardsae]
MHQRSAAPGVAEVVSEERRFTRWKGNSPHRSPGTLSRSARETMGEGGDVSDTDSDETIIEGSVGESDLDEEEFRGKRLSLIGKDMAPKTENNYATGIKITNGEMLSPEIKRICKLNNDLHVLRQTEPIELLYQETSKKEKASQSLLQPEGLNNEDSPEISLLSGIHGMVELSKDSITKCTGVPETFHRLKVTSNKEDATESGLSAETAATGITTSRMMVEKFEVQDFMEPLCDSENSQISPLLHMLEYQDNALYVTESWNENSALPDELLAALNSLSESVAPSVCQPVRKEGGHSMEEKQPTSEQTDDDCTQITEANFESQFHVLKEPLSVTKLPFPSEEQLDCDQNMQKLVILDNQPVPPYNKTAGKENSILEETSSCKQTIQVTSYGLRKSFPPKRELPCFAVDAASKCKSFLEQKIQNDQAKTRTSDQAQESNTEGQADQCSQLGNDLCHSLASDVNTKVEQVRKSQRITKKNGKQTVSKNCSSHSYFSNISLSRINRRDIFGQTLLHKAAMENDIKGVHAMIKAGANVNAQDYAGWTPLHEASVAGFFEITKELLKAGADVNCKGNEEITALHEAVSEGHYKVAELLLWYGANPLLKEAKGKSAIEEATDSRMRTLLERYVDKSSRKPRSAKRHIEDPVNDKRKTDKNPNQPKVKTNSRDKVRISFSDNTKILRQHSIKQNKEKSKPKSNSIIKIQRNCRLLKETISKSQCPVSKAKQSVTGIPPSSLDTLGSKMRKREQRKVTQNDSIDTRLYFSKRVLQPSVSHHKLNRICETGEQPSGLTKTWQESESINSNNCYSSEGEKAHQSTQLSETTEGQLSNSHIATSLIPIQGSVLPSVTHHVNEPSVDSTNFLNKDSGLPLLEEGQYIMNQHSNAPSYLQVDSLGDNLQTAQNIMLIGTVGEEGINPTKEQNGEHYIHSENPIYQFNLGCHTEVILEHDLGLEEENMLESKGTTTQLLQGTAHFNDSDCTVLSEHYNFIADQNADKNTSKAVGICNEQIVQVDMEMSSTCAFSQGINSTDFSESLDTYSSTQLRIFTPPMHEDLVMGPRALGITGKCCLERTENGSSLENNTILDLQVFNKVPFQDTHQTEKQQIPDAPGWTPIHEASSGGYTEVIAELLKAGADVNCKSLDGVLPIHAAVSGNHFEAVQLLLHHGANTNETDCCGKNALDEATCDKMIELLKSYGATETKKTPEMSDVAGRELRPPKSRRTHNCYDCYKKDNLVSHPNSAKQKSGAHESLSKILQDIEEKQDKLLLFELKKQRDADLYIQDLSQIQNILNGVLAKQKSERDDLAKKYRASAESFKQGALREQLVKLVSRQKSLLLMAQKQKELGQKILNYNNAKKDPSGSAKQMFSSYPDVVMDLETSSVVKNSSLDQEMNQLPNRSLNVSGDGDAIRQKRVGLHNNMMPENRLGTCTIAKDLNSKTLDSIDQATLLSEPGVCSVQTAQSEEIDYISVAPQGNKHTPATPRTSILNFSASGNAGVAISQPTNENQYVCSSESLQQRSNISEEAALESTHNCLATHQKEIVLNNQTALDDNLELTEMFSHALSPSTFSQNPSQSSDNQDSEKQFKFKTNRRRRKQLLDLLELGRINPGDDVLEFTLQCVLRFLTESSYQPNSLKTPKRFLQFSEIVLIKDEEFMPCHIMDQYWNFYVHCENFGF